MSEKTGRVTIPTDLDVIPQMPRFILLIIPPERTMIGRTPIQKKFSRCM